MASGTADETGKDAENQPAPTETRGQVQTSAERQDQVTIDGDEERKGAATPAPEEDDAIYMVKDDHAYDEPK